VKKAHIIDHVLYNLVQILIECGKADGDILGALKRAAGIGYCDMPKAFLLFFVYCLLLKWWLSDYYLRALAATA
jgi:hypothetical protein